MIVKRKIIVGKSEYKRELTTMSRKAHVTICEFYKCKYRDLEGRCTDKNKQQCIDCKALNFDNRFYNSYFYIHQ